MAVDIKTVSSHLEGDEHAAFFEADLQLFAELDAAAVERIKAVRGDIPKLAAELKSLHKELAPLLALPVLGPALRALPSTILKALGITGAEAATATLCLLTIECAVIAARGAELFYDDAHAVHGGVFIEFVFPSPQILSQIYPRGGFKSSSAMGEAAELARSITDKLAHAAHGIERPGG